MPLELNLRNVFQDFNQSKFLVYSCLMIFSLLFALRLDDSVQWSYWIIFLPIWIWKLMVLVGASVGSWVWWRHPNYRMDIDSYVQYKAMIICTGMHALLLMFELLACDKLQNNRSQVLWILVFIPLIFMSVVSIGICVWAVKHERTFELELFCSANILQFVFLALRLDGFIQWNWVIVLIPVWIVMCIALIGVLYAVILAIILLKSPDIIPEQRRGNMFSAVGYTCLVIPLLVFEVLLVNKADKAKNYKWIEVFLPLIVSLFTLVLMSFGAKGANQWWFGLRKEFCSWFLAICPVLQEYGNISYKMTPQENTSNNQQPPSDQNIDRNTNKSSQTMKKSSLDIGQGGLTHIVSIEMPD